MKMKNLPGRNLGNLSYASVKRIFFHRISFPIFHGKLFSTRTLCEISVGNIFFMEATVPQLSKEIEEGIAFNLSANFIPTDLTRLPIESVEIEKRRACFSVGHTRFSGKLPLIFTSIKIIVLDVIEATDSSMLSQEIPAVYLLRGRMTSIHWSVHCTQTSRSCTHTLRNILLFPKYQRFLTQMHSSGKEKRECEKLTFQKVFGSETPSKILPWSVDNNWKEEETFTEKFHSFS